MPIGIGQRNQTRSPRSLTTKSAYSIWQSSQTEIERMHLADPVICSDYRVGFTVMLLIEASVRRMTITCQGGHRLPIRQHVSGHRRNLETSIDRAQL
jgi:hypothetical protein